MFQHPLIHQELARQRSLELRVSRQGRGLKRSAGADPATHEVADTVHGARAGDERAWEALVTRFTPALRATARSYRLNAADVEDAVQSTWTAAFTHIDGIREPEALGGWLMVTVRREALHILRARQREVPVAEVPEQIAADAPAPETGLRNWERRKKALRAAVELLPDRQRSLVSALTSQPGSTYDELSQRLGMPVGAIGPTRQRALARLRRNRELMMLSEADAS